MSAFYSRFTRLALRGRNAPARAALDAIASDPELSDLKRSAAIAPLHAEIVRNGDRAVAEHRRLEADARAKWLAAVPRARRVRAGGEAPREAQAVRDLATTLPPNDLITLVRSATEGPASYAVLFGVETALRSRDDLSLDELARVQAELDRPFLSDHDYAFATYVVARQERAASQIEGTPEGLFDPKRVLTIVNEALTIPPEEAGGALVFLQDTDVSRFYAMVDVAQAMP